MINEHGEWEVKGNVKALKKPSQEYINSKLAQEELYNIYNQRNNILKELSELDKEIPRILEDVIEFVGFTPHESKKVTLDRKKELREQLNLLT